MGELSGLPNIGPKIEEQLKAVGIDTAEELRRIGAENAWLRIQAMDPSACIHRLEGAIQGGKKTALPPERRAALKAFYETRKK